MATTVNNSQSIDNVSSPDENCDNDIHEKNNNSEQEKQKVITNIIDEREEKIHRAKKKMMNDMTKQQLVNVIYKQNNIIASQSSQLLELVALANSVEKNARSEESKKCDAVIHENAACMQTNEIQNKRLMIYDISTRVQILLFIILLTILVWLFYTILNTKNDSTQKV